MSVIVAVVVPAEDFPLGQALSTNPSIQINLERAVPVGQSFVPYFRAADDGVEAIETALGEADDVDSFQIVDRADGEVLVRVDWATTVDGFLEAISATAATVLDGVGEANRWRFQLRFDDHHQLTQFYRRCVDHDVSVVLESVYHAGAQGIDPALDLTENQRETLVLALERGYFEVPRRTDLGSLAEELGISDSAVSQRLRRGISRVVSTVDLEADEPMTE